MAFFLKEYQRQVVERMDEYLRRVAEAKEKYDRVPEEYRKEINDYNEKVWNALNPDAEKLEITRYRSKKTGHGQWCPNWCLKIPTGGGKTW